jgi:hypothetical protein
MKVIECDNCGAQKRAYEPRPMWFELRFTPVVPKSVMLSYDPISKHLCSAECVASMAKSIED